ncbi:hypothetical protein [Streptomyces phaeochromogenes]|uniref:hypothetical protein n=1 Tax=Streptomyces phaeochromogenes TaxID=1923 RepID=UPI002DD83ED2|nr:hypothetical protein [Streptomyces phaeochromogenes]WRZ32227.1 hypothetical protein OG931_33115 [Streptomyces phaeochromogenes]
MSTVPSADAKAVVRALEGLTTQVRRLADTRQSDFVLSADATDDDATTPATTWTPGPLVVAEAVEWARGAGKASATIEALTANAGCSEHPNAGSVGPYCLACVIVPPPTNRRPPMDPVHILGIKAPAADEDAPLAACRIMFTRTCPQSYAGPCGDRAARGVLNDHEATALRARAQQVINGRETWKAKAEEIEQDRDRLKTILEYEHKRANDAIDREETAEQAAEEQRRRADIFETELRTLRAGLRANGADPTQIQNLWAQIRLRNRQWAEAKREVRVVRSELEEEGGDVALVDEMLATVADAEARARQAEEKLSESETLGHKILKRAENAEATIARVRATLSYTFMAGPDAMSVVRADKVRAALDSSEPRNEQMGPP